MRHRKIMKYLCSFLISLALIFIVTPVLLAETDSLEFDLQARSAVLMEAETGEIIYAKKADLRLPPASMTKIMTMLLVMEAVEEGIVSLEDEVIVSEKAASMGGSQVFLEAGEIMTLAEMMKAVAIASANDASVAVAEYVYGTEKEFVRKMNARAQELGLENTLFVNTNGLPEEEQGNYSSAHDLAVMTREIVKYEKVLEWTSTWIDYLRGGDFVLNNTNKLVHHFKGADGLKTGHTSEARFCVASTAYRDGLRFIAVIMGVENSKQRFDEAAQLLSYGFNIYDSILVHEQGESIGEIPLFSGEKQQVEIIVEEEIRVPVRKGSGDQVRKETIIDEKILPPVTKYEVLGTIDVYRQDEILKTVNLIAAENVERAGYFKLSYRYFKEIVLGLIGILN